MPSLDNVPDEIVRQVLLFVSPEDNLVSVQLLARRLGHLANEPLLWRHHCRRSYKYWAPERRLPEKLAAKASEVEWKALWIERKRLNARNQRLFDGLLSTKVGRLRKLGKICELGYDAKDFLLEQVYADDSVDDVLARRYGRRPSLILPSPPCGRRVTDLASDTMRTRPSAASTGVWPSRSGIPTRRRR